MEETTTDFIMEICWETKVPGICSQNLISWQCFCSYQSVAPEYISISKSNFMDINALSILGVLLGFSSLLINPILQILKYYCCFISGSPQDSGLNPGTWTFFHVSHVLHYDYFIHIPGASNSYLKNIINPTINCGKLIKPEFSFLLLCDKENPESFLWDMLISGKK